MEASEFNNIIAVCQVFGQLPSAYVRRLLGKECPPFITSLDWYAFDVAAVDRYSWLVAQANKDAQRTNKSRERMPQRHPQPAPVAASDGDDDITMGFYEEKPPWQH